jgi:hypothetical protein
MILSLLAGCGSTGATHTAATATQSPAAARGTGAAAGRETATTRSTGVALAPAACAKVEADTMGTVAARVYHEAATGGDVAQAVHRVQSSRVLAEAVNSGNGTAANMALQELMLGQIVRIEVLRGGHVIARSGSGSAIAPVRGSIPGTGATFVLSTQASHSYAEVVRQVTGAKVRLAVGAAGSAGGASAGYRRATIAGAAYPASPLRIVLLVPAAGVSCPGSAGQARVETMGRVGERIYAEELHSPDVAKTIRHIEASAAFREAVAARDPAAARSAIVGFFREHIHVVRVRVSTGAGLLVDVGGPYVLAPVKGTVHKDNRTVGAFEMAIQDDAGYLKLAHLFTGAEVLMREGRRQLMGTLKPGPATVPDRGPVSYGGHAYEAYSFTRAAFPEGRLRISLLLPTR